MSYERFTDRVRTIMQLAHQEAQRLNRGYLGTDDVLVAILKDGGGEAAFTLTRMGLDLSGVRRAIETIHPYQDPVGEASTTKLPETPAVKQAIEYAVTESRLAGHNYVGDTDVLLGILKSDLVTQILQSLHVHPMDVITKLRTPAAK